MLLFLYSNSLARQDFPIARFKPTHKGLKLLAVDFDQQILPGTFEHALCHLIDHELDLSALHARYKNDDGGASAFNPAALLKIILLAYSRGIIFSRKIEAACRENMVFIAVSGDSQPHFTTIAAFVSTLGDNVAALFAQVLLVCDRQGLIGREMFAIDGVKLPANASGLLSKYSNMKRRLFPHGGGYDRNVTEPATLEKMIEYIPMNRVRKGLVDRATDWRWSSAQ